jgi:cytoskeletal protein RodZ
MESIGEILREARHRKRASLEDAARATKIKLEILEQLEADEFDRLAAPAYTKGFLKLYADYLGLDSQQIVDSYLQSQGGLRREGLQLQTEKAIRDRKPRELQLPLRSVALVVAGLTLAVFATIIGWNLWQARSTEQPQPTQPPVPVADFDAYYRPASEPAPELLEPPPAR